MKTILQSKSIRRIVCLSTLAGFCSPLFGQTPVTVNINAASVVRNVPVGMNGVCAASEFWNSTTPDYRTDMMKAQVGLVRIAAYPVDSQQTISSLTLEQLDIKVAQVINAGGIPLFIQGIESASNNPPFYRALYRTDGTLYSATDTTPMHHRIATNVAFLVQRYKNAPYGLTTQYWEVGNEPNISDYYFCPPAEYINIFKTVHNRLTVSGLRGNVILMGPVNANDYGDNGPGNTMMREFLPACKNEVDIVTRHSYAGLWWYDNPAGYTPYHMLNDFVSTRHFDHTVTNSLKGEGALLALMNSSGVPADVGTGWTELNVGGNQAYPGAPVTDFYYTITQGLWFLMSDHYMLYNPRSKLRTSFQFDRYHVTSNADSKVAFYNSSKVASFPYWATYLQHVLTGNQVLAQSSSNSHLLVTATKDASYLYVRLLNRHNSASYAANVNISNPPPVSSPTLFNFTTTVMPGVGSPVSYGANFTRNLAPMTACVIRYPRTDAPTPPAPSPTPTRVHLDHIFTTAPAGMKTYAVGFTPVVASGKLQLTNTVANSRAAVIFDGQRLTAASTTRLQARFSFKVVQDYAEGFVFGAYYANPGEVGNGGQALGYEGQERRLWAVKIDNNPNEIGIVPNLVNSSVDGFVSRPIPAYANVDMYAVIDYDGAARSVRARLYRGVSEAGVLQADITNKVGNFSSLPAGTVFGFTGSCGSFSQQTFIDSLRILVP